MLLLQMKIFQHLEKLSKRYTKTTIFPHNCLKYYSIRNAFPTPKKNLLNWFPSYETESTEDITCKFQFIFCWSVQKKCFFLAIIFHINTRNEDHKISHISCTKFNVEKPVLKVLQLMWKCIPTIFKVTITNLP